MEENKNKQEEQEQERRAAIAVLTEQEERSVTGGRKPKGHYDTFLKPYP